VTEAYIGKFEYPLGTGFVAASKSGVVLVTLKCEYTLFKNRLQEIGFNPIQWDNSCTNPYIEQINKYFSSNEQPQGPVYFVKLTPFERRVLDATSAIPVGTCVTYKELAQKLGNTNLARAVGNVLAKNPVPIFIPCHRVIRNNLAVGNYQFSTVVKRFLLDHERSFVHAEHQC
jgi:methylated-DNA-[protein]-cysteine S-methyltransferase